MATDAKTIQNQKVFVMLTDVTKVQAEFLRLLHDAHNEHYLRGMARVIKELGLPIDTGKF